MGSVRRRGRVVRVGLDDPEVVLLASLVGQVRAMLTDDLPDATEDPAAPLEAFVGLSAEAPAAPDDPVLRRLLPDAYRDDPESAGEYHRLMDADLRAQKGAALQRILDDLASGGTRKGSELRIELDDNASQQWLYGINDVRLVLGTSLDVSEDLEEERASLGPESPRYLQLGIYDWVTWLQDAIVGAVSGG